MMDQKFVSEVVDSASKYNTVALLLEAAFKITY